VTGTPPDVARPESVTDDRPDGAPITPARSGRGDAVLRGVERGLRVLLVLVGAAFVVGYVVIALMRMRYPFELEWMEGGVVDDVRRILAGHSLYVRPSTHFVPYIYTPLYYYVAAVPAKILGVGYFPLRLVSFLASLVTFGCIGALAWTETRDGVAAFAAAALFAACFRLGGAWLDLARVDPLFLALLFAGLLVARRARSPRGALGAALLLVLAFLTKQSAVFPAVGVVFFLWMRRRSLALWYGGALAAGIGGSTVLWNMATHGWYRFYVIDVPGAHRIVSEEYGLFWTHDILLRLWITVALAVLGLWWTGRTRTDDGVRLAWFHVPVAAALLGAAYQARLHSGGYDNVLLPAFGALAILFGLGIHGSRSFLPRVTWLAPVAAVLAIVQLATLTYDPGKQLPTAADRRTGERMLTALRDLPGTVYLPGHGWYLARAHKTTGAQSAAIEDVIRADVRGTGRALRNEVRDDIATGRFDWVVVDNVPTFSYLPKTLRRTYVRVGTLVPPRHPPLPLTGTLTGPLTVWARRDPPPPGPVPATVVPAS
jgi:hypothetical protein